MPRPSIRTRKLTEGIKHQALCKTCRFAGPERDSRDEAETDAENHVLIPKYRNHRVGLSTIETSVINFKLRR